MYGHTVLGKRRSDVMQDTSAGRGNEVDGNGRPRRSTRTDGVDHTEGYNSADTMDEETDAASSGNEWGGAGGEDEFGADDEVEDDASESESLDEDDVDLDRSLVVKLRFNKGGEFKHQKLDPGAAATSPKEDVENASQPATKDVKMTDDTVEQSATKSEQMPPTAIQPQPPQPDADANGLPTPPTVELVEKRERQPNTNGVI